MRAPLLSFVLVLAVVATVSLVPAVSKVEEAGAAAAEENGGSIKPLSWSLDGYGPQEKAAKKPKEQILDVQGTPKMTADTYNQEPIEKQAEVAKTSTADDQPNKYVASLDPEKEKEKKEAAAEVKKEKSNESADESAYAKKEKKVKKEKKDKSDYLDASTSSKKEKKEESDDSESDESADESAYTKMEKKVKKEKKEKSDDSDKDASLTKKEKKEKSDDSDEDASLTKKEKKKHKKVKSDDDDSDSTSPKKSKKEKSIDSDASSSYLKQEEKKTDDADDEATSLKKQKEKKKKKLKKEKSSEEEENAEDDAEPVDVSPGGKYVPSEKPNSDATPADVSTTTDEYVSSWTKPKKGERQISINPDAFASPDELPPVEKSSATPDAYPSPNQQQELVVRSSQSQPMAAGSPDELPPSTKPKTTTFDPYASSKHQVFSSQQQPMAGNSPDELPPQAKTYDQEPSPAAAAGGEKPKPTTGTLSGMIKTPIANLLSPVIKGVCAKATFPADCEASIAGLPGAASAAATDSVGVLKLAMEAVREKVIVAMNAATDRMHAPGLDPSTKDALDACTSSYSDMKSSLDYVDDALKRGDVDTAKTNLDAVETDLNTCDDGFKEHGEPLVMNDHDQELQKLASNLVYIGSTIKHE